MTSGVVIKFDSCQTSCICCPVTNAGGSAIPSCTFRNTCSRATVSKNNKSKDHLPSSHKLTNGGGTRKSHEFRSAHPCNSLPCILRTSKSITPKGDVQHSSPTKSPHKGFEVVFFFLTPHTSMMLLVRSDNFFYKLATSFAQRLASNVLAPNSMHVVRKRKGQLCVQLFTCHCGYAQ